MTTFESFFHPISFLPNFLLPCLSAQKYEWLKYLIQKQIIQAEWTEWVIILSS